MASWEACQLKEKCTHVLAQTVANHQRYLLSQNQTDQFIVRNVCQNTKNQDFKKDTKT